MVFLSLQHFVVSVHTVCSRVTVRTAVTLTPAVKDSVQNPRLMDRDSDGEGRPVRLVILKINCMCACVCVRGEGVVIFFILFLHLPLDILWGALCVEQRGNTGKTYKSWTFIHDLLLMLVFECGSCVNIAETVQITFYTKEF